jgi:lysophospholipid acyltransferase (LPLAT)-like uncharacterized protein
MAKVIIVNLIKCGMILNMSLKPLFAFAIIKLLSFSYRYEYLNSNDLEKVLDEHGNYLFALWHQNLIGAILSQSHKSHAVIVSPSNDGELVAQTCQRMGHKIARGSSSRGGQTALKQMIRYLKEGHPGAITIDGPRGPAHQPKKGIFELAYLTKTPIIPVTVLPKSYWTIHKSWDQFKIPKPFTRFIIHYGAPLLIDKDSKNDHFNQASLDLKQQLEHSEHYINSILGES